MVLRKTYYPSKHVCFISGSNGQLNKFRLTSVIVERRFLYLFWMPILWYAIHVNESLKK